MSGTEILAETNDPDDPSDDQVALAWVRVNGESRHVSDFAHVPHNIRPSATCLVCERRVIMRLGNVRAHHAAHRPGAICRTTNRLVALYLNTKAHIGKALEGGDSLRIAVPCRNSGCKNRCEIEWVKVWTTVTVEYELGSTFPDIRLFGEDGAIAAIDVSVSPTFDVDKAKERRRASIPWVVVRAATTICRRVGGWNSEKPLPVEVGGTPDARECPKCEEQNGERPRRFRIVDLYYPDGKVKREVYVTYASRRNGIVVSMRLAGPRGTIRQVNGQGDKQTLALLKSGFRAEINQIKKEALRIDSTSTGWERFPPGVTTLSPSDATLSTPFRYIWRDNRWLPRSDDEVLPS